MAAGVCPRLKPSKSEKRGFSTAFATAVASGSLYGNVVDQPFGQWIDTTRAAAPWKNEQQGAQYSPASIGLTALEAQKRESSPQYLGTDSALFRTRARRRRAKYDPEWRMIMDAYVLYTKGKLQIAHIPMRRYASDFTVMGILAENEEAFRNMDPKNVVMLCHPKVLANVYAGLHTALRGRFQGFPFPSLEEALHTFTAVSQYPHMAPRLQAAARYAEMMGGGGNSLFAPPKSGAMEIRVDSLVRPTDYATAAQTLREKGCDAKEMAELRKNVKYTLRRLSRRRSGGERKKWLASQKAESVKAVLQMAKHLKVVDPKKSRRWNLKGVVGLSQWYEVINRFRQAWQDVLRDPDATGVFDKITHLNDTEKQHYLNVAVMKVVEQINVPLIHDSSFALYKDGVYKDNQLTRLVTDTDKIAEVNAPGYEWKLAEVWVWLYGSNTALVRLLRSGSSVPTRFYIEPQTPLDLEANEAFNKIVRNRLRGLEEGRLAVFRQVEVSAHEFNKEKYAPNRLWVNKLDDHPFWGIPAKARDQTAAAR